MKTKVGCGALIKQNNKILYIAHWTVTKPTEDFPQFLTIFVGGEIRSQKLEGGKKEAAFPYKPYIPPPSWMQISCLALLRNVGGGVGMVGGMASPLSR